MFWNCELSTLSTSEHFRNDYSAIFVDLRTSVRSLLFNPPYNDRMVLGRNIYFRDKFEKLDMKQFFKPVREILAPGCHKHFFCSAIKFSVFHSVLSSQKVSSNDFLW